MERNSDETDEFRLYEHKKMTDLHISAQTAEMSVISRLKRLASKRATESKAAMAEVHKVENDVKRATWWRSISAVVQPTLDIERANLAAAKKKALEYEEAATIAREEAAAANAVWVVIDRVLHTEICDQIVSTTR